MRKIVQGSLVIPLKGVADFWKVLSFSDSGVFCHVENLKTRQVKFVSVASLRLAELWQPSLFRKGV